MRQIQFQMACCADEREVHDNVLATLKRGYEGLTEYLNAPNDEISIAGAGPSVADTYRTMRGRVMAVNSAVNFLIDRSRPPTLAMLWDASPLVAEFAVPHPQVAYLVNARCHPYVFERLQGQKVVVWFADGDFGVKRILQERGINEPLIKGGSAGVTRAMFLAFAMGYRKIHLHGADSSARGGATHIQGSVAKENEMRLWLDKEGAGPSFTTTPELAIQAREFGVIKPMFRRLGAKVEVHGEGLLPHINRMAA